MASHVERHAVRFYMVVELMPMEPAGPAHDTRHRGAPQAMAAWSAASVYIAHLVGSPTKENARQQHGPPSVAHSGTSDGSHRASKFA